MEIDNKLNISMIIDDQVWDRVYEQIEPIIEIVKFQIREQVSGSIMGQLRDNWWDPVETRVVTEVGGQVKKSIRG